MDFTAIHTTRIEEALAVVHCDPLYPYLPVSKAGALGIPAGEERAAIYVFRARETTSHLTLALGVHTPVSVRNAWRDFLTPPLAAQHHPVFTLDEARHVGDADGIISNAVDSLAYRARGKEDSDWMRYDACLDILMNVPWVSHEAIFKAATAACGIYPGLLARYTLVPEFVPAPGYALAIADHQAEVIRSDETFDRQVYLEARAKADTIWRDRILPLLTLMDESRTMVRPNYLREQDEIEEMDDAVLTGELPLPAEEYARAQTEDALPDFELTRRHAEMYSAISDPYALAIEISRLAGHARQDPLLPVESALRWLEGQSAVSNR